MILVDSNIFIAYFNEADFNHNEAVEIMRYLEDKRPVITDYIFSEIITVILLKKKEKQMAIEAGKEILSSKTRIVKVNKEIFHKAWRLFQESELNMSFTDFTNLAVLELLRIENIATFDKDFKNIKNIQVIDK